MRFYLSSLFIFIWMCSSAQVDFTRDYYPFVYRAELAIIKEDYLRALKCYDTAFANVGKPFARDYFNAAVAATKANQFSTAFRYCDSLIAKGVTKDFFTTCGSFRPLWETTKWRTFVDAYEQKYEQFNKGRDTTLIPLLTAMAHLDQEFRQKPGSYRAYRDTIRKIDSANIVQLRAIIQTYGFPNENMINKFDPTNMNFPAYIVFHHYCQSLSQNREGRYNFINDFISAVKKGELDPHRFAFLLSLQGEKSLVLGGWGVSTCLINGVRGKLMGERFSEEKKALIDKNRPDYGLEPLEDYYRKAVFTLRDSRAKEFAFRVYEHINLFEMESDEQCEKFMAASLILE